jgi:hypothetical protein
MAASFTVAQPLKHYMKKYFLLLTTAMLGLGFEPAFAQMGGPPRAPQFDGALTKVFGDNSAFTATLKFQVTPKSGDPVTLPGKIAFDAGKARFEMNLSGATGLKIPAGAAAQMKSIGLDQITTISLPGKNFVYLVYPGLQSYMEKSLPDALTGTNLNFKVATIELAKETVDGHSCVENQVVVTDGQGSTNEFTVWNATDLKNFPVKIVRNTGITLSFSDVSLAKPAADSFEPPAGYTRYDDMQTMVQTEMMKKMGGGLSLPTGH